MTCRLCYFLAMSGFAFCTRSVDPRRLYDVSLILRCMPCSWNIIRLQLFEHQTEFSSISRTRNTLYLSCVNSKSYCRSMFLRRLPMNVEQKRKSHAPSISDIDSDRRASSGSTESGSHLPHRHARNSSHSDMCYSTATCHFKMLL